MLNTLSADFRIIFDRDPAARNWIEVLFCYPGVQALIFYRLAHWFYCLNVPFIPRLISYVIRFWTGIEIHPVATHLKNYVYLFCIPQSVCGAIAI